MELFIGKRFAIVPGTYSENLGQRIPIVLGYGKAFGSGGHETTRSCLEELEDISGIKGMTVLDFGCGTGILAVAAVKLGAKRVTAVDTDPDAITATISNRRLNGLDDRIDAIAGSLDQAGDDQFDLIIANLYGDLILANLEAMSSVLKPCGIMLLSGIRYEYAFDIKTKAVSLGFEKVRQIMLADFCTFVFQRHGAAHKPLRR
ncbi:50S ribosomal protein L11 methyltransferase [Acidobacteriota bacterium]